MLQHYGLSMPPSIADWPRADAPAVFFDTNVVLYLLSAEKHKLSAEKHKLSAEKHKTNSAEALLAQGGWVSIQVLNEVASVCRSKLKLPRARVHDLLADEGALYQGGS